jgi:nitroreductase
MPMDFMDISKMRITVRRYDPRPVEKDKIDCILEAGRWAPTAVDYQPQRILVMDRPEHFLKIREFCTFGFD